MKEKTDIWSEEAVGEKPKAQAQKAKPTQKPEKKKEEKTNAKKEEKQAGKKIPEIIEKKSPKITVAKAGEKTESGIELGEVLYFPLISEKAVGAIEAQNKITFIVNKKASKTDVKNAVEKLYGVKIESVNTMRDPQGRKKAIVRLNKAFKAQELATKLGVI
jgi:ribosomal protein uL23